MRKAAARAAPNVGRNEPNSKFAAENAKGGLAAAFSSLAGGKRDYGAPRGAPESQEKLEKERRSAKSGRKAANRAPNATLDPGSEAPGGVSCHPASKTVQNRSFPAKKNLLNAASI